MPSRQRGDGRLCVVVTPAMLRTQIFVRGRGEDGTSIRKPRVTSFRGQVATKAAKTPHFPSGLRDVFRTHRTALVGAALVSNLFLQRDLC